MKKQVFILVMCILPVLIWSAGNLNLSLGYSFPGEHNLSIESDYIGDGEADINVSGNIAAFAEYITESESGQGMIYGFGAHYLFDHEFDSADIEEMEIDGTPAFSFLPIYAIGGYELPLNENSSLRGLVNLGYNFFMPNDDYAPDADIIGGFYWGIGGGITMNDKFFVEALYCNYAGGYEYDGTDIEAEAKQSAFIIRLGLKLKK